MKKFVGIKEKALDISTKVLDLCETVGMKLDYIKMYLEKENLREIET